MVAALSKFLFRWTLSADQALSPWTDQGNIIAYLRMHPDSRCKSAANRKRLHLSLGRRASFRIFQMIDIQCDRAAPQEQYMVI